MSTLLIADDDVNLAQILEIQFSSLGYTVLVVHNGEDAEKTILEKKPDMAILDILMPKKSGIEVLEDIRNNPETKDLAVIVLTNLSQKKDRDRVSALGAKDYIVKVNMSLDQLVEKVNNYLKNVKSA